MPTRVTASRGRPRRSQHPTASRPGAAVRRSALPPPSRGPATSPAPGRSPLPNVRRSPRAAGRSRPARLPARARRALVGARRARRRERGEDGRGRYGTRARVRYAKTGAMVSERGHRSWRADDGDRTDRPSSASPSSTLTTNDRVLTVARALLSLLAASVHDTRCGIGRRTARARTSSRTRRPA